MLSQTNEIPNVSDREARAVDDLPDDPGDDQQHDERCERGHDAERGVPEPVEDVPGPAEAGGRAGRSQRRPSTADSFPAVRGAREGLSPLRHMMFT